MRDRMTKILLSLIAVALWALLLRPAVTPAPAEAQAVPQSDLSPLGRFARPIMYVPANSPFVYVIDNAGFLYRLDSVSLEIQRSVRLTPKR